MFSRVSTNDIKCISRNDWLLTWFIFYENSFWKFPFGLEAQTTTPTGEKTVAVYFKVILLKNLRNAQLKPSFDFAVALKL